MSTHPLRAEIETYNAKLPELVANIGKFVLIQNGDIIGLFDTYNDALVAGYERFKLDPFLVKQIAPAEQVQFFSRELESACQA